MKVGELFFSLGFKSFGMNEAERFEGFISQSRLMAESLSNSLGDITTILGQMAVKMKAITKDDLAQFEKNKEKNKQLLESNKTDKKTNEIKKESIKLYDVQGGRIKKFVESIKSSRMVLIGLGGALGYAMKGALDFQHSMGVSGTVTGYSMQTIEKLRGVAAKSGVDIKELMGQVQNIQEKWVALSAGEQVDIMPFARLGLPIGGDPIEIIGKLGKALKTMRTDVGTKYARDLGFSNEMIAMAKAYGDEIERIGQTATKSSNVAKLNGFAASMNRLWDQGQRIFVKFANAVSPILIPMMNALEKFAGDILPHFIGRFGRFIDDLSGKLPNLKIVALAIAAILFPLTAKITALVLVFDDLYAFFKGEKSLFGKFLNYITDTNGALKDMIGLLLKIGDIFNFEGWNKFKDTTGKKWDSMKGMIKGGWDTVTKPLAPVKSFKEGFGGGFSAPTKNTTNNNNVKINVNGAQDPKKVAEEIERTLGSIYWQTRRGEVV